VKARFNWKRMSIAGMLAYRPDGSRARVLWHTHPGAYNDLTLIEVLKHLRRHLRGKVTLIWDGLPSHRSKRMKAWIATERGWLVAEQLPGYAPDLNPVEPMWSSLKGVEMANLCVDTIDECIDAANQGLQRIRSDRQLAFSFLRSTGLSL
jgi:transposase